MRLLHAPLLAACLLPLACGPAGPAPVEPASLEGLEPDVRSLVVGRIEAVRAAPDDATEHRRLAMAYEANNMWEEAERAHATVLELVPSDHLSRFHRGIALRELGRLDESLEVLEGVAADLPSEPAVQHRLGLALLEVDRLSEAENAFRMVATTMPEAPHGHHGLAQVALRRSDPDTAVDLCQEALQRAPQAKTIQYTLGQALRDKGDKEEAKRFLTLGAGADPMFLGDRRSGELSSYAVSSSGRLMRAGELISMGEHASAVSLLLQVRESLPDDATVLNNLSVAYIEQGKFDQALEVLDHFVETNPGVAAAYHNQIVCFMAKKQLPAALDAGRKAVQAGPQIAAMHMKYAEVLTAANSYSEAYGELLTARRLGIRTVLIHNALGETAVRNNDEQTALRHFGEAVELDPDNLAGHYNRGRMALKVGRLDIAREAQKEMLRLAPKHERTQMLAAEIDRAGR